MDVYRTQSRNEPSGLADAERPLAPPAPADVRGGDQIDALRTIARQMATAEDLEIVLRSIVTALVERPDMLVARIFLQMTDQECAICHARIEAGSQAATGERALHLAAAAGIAAELGGLYHRVPLDSPLPVAQVTRTRTPTLVQDWRRDERFARNPELARLWGQLGAVALAAYPLDFRGEFLGAIAYLSRQEIPPPLFELLGIFADQAAMAIKNARLYQELERYEARLQAENAYLKEEIRTATGLEGFEDIVGGSAALKSVIRQVKQVAGVETTVLLTGETGTGKELVARAIHALSARRDRPMIKVNCGAIPQGVVESELFGHERGAFTGALQRRIGRFELADKGTLFMDEVGELPLDTQIKLLRVLQEQELERVGGGHPIRVDVRLIAATNRDLEREVAEGRFRADLFYRLNVFPIHIPPLRERPADIPILVRHFLAHFQRKLGKPLKGIAPESLDRLRRYEWPGNIRELQNVMERACVLARGPVVELADAFQMSGGEPSAEGARDDEPIMTLEEGERMLVRRALAATNGKIHGPGGAAELLGLNGNTLRSRMQKLGIGKHVS